MNRNPYMQRAIELAKKGVGRVNPNPLVGAVIVKDGRIIGEGYHAKYGELHAERQAFANLTEDAKGAELYVTLEPCCHYGKQPPCTDAIIEHGIRKVYVGSHDPNALVAGGGIQRLREAGIEVESGLMKEECDALNPVFFHFIQKKTPYVVMKYAMTMDGKIATYAGNSRWITGEAARAEVAKLRNALMAIMVGSGTVIQDNPRLTCRMEGGRNPIRIVCDGSLATPPDSILVQTADETATWIATTEAQKDSPRAIKLQEKGVELLYLPERDGHPDLQILMEKLGERGVDGLLLEGGSTLNESAMRAGIVSCVQVYIAPKIFGGEGLYTPVGGKGVAFPDEAWCFGEPKVRTFAGGDILLTYHRIEDTKG